MVEESTARKGYSTRVDPEIHAVARGKELPISPKHSTEICRKLRHMYLDDAIAYLDEVIEMKTPVAFKRHKKYVPHRKGKGFGPGRFPVKAASRIKKLLENAEQNAEYKGLETDMLFIRHISAYKGQTTQGWRPRAHGRSSPWNHETVNIEVVLEEMEE